MMSLYRHDDIVSIGDGLGNIRPMIDHSLTR